MPAVFLGHVCPSGSLRSPCYSSWEGTGRREEDVILTSSWKQERVGVWEQCHLPLLLLERCPLWPGLPANSHKQVCTPTIWSLPPKSEPKEASRLLNLPLAASGRVPDIYLPFPSSSPVALNSISTTQGVRQAQTGWLLGPPPASHRTPPTF